MVNMKQTMSVSASKYAGFVLLFKLFFFAFIKNYFCLTKNKTLNALRESLSRRKDISEAGGAVRLVSHLKKR